MGDLVVIVSISTLLPQRNKILKLKKNVEKVVLALRMKCKELFMKENCLGDTHGERERKFPKLHYTRRVIEIRRTSPADFQLFLTL